MKLGPEVSDRQSARGGVGIELTEQAVRGVRIDAASSVGVAATGEFTIRSADDERLLDALVLLNAELGEPSTPTRIATFPAGATLQRVDVTGRSETDVGDIRERMRTDHGVRSSVISTDGPRRWLLLIRWDEMWIERVRTLASRAGLVDVVVEPSPMSIGRVAGVDATYAHRVASQGDGHHTVLQHRVPVAAASTVPTGRADVDLEIACGTVPLTGFEEYLDHAVLRDSVDRFATRAGDLSQLERADPQLGGVLDAGSDGRHVIALGAAIGAAGLLGPIDPIHVAHPTAGIGGDPFDRPWAIEAVPIGDDGDHIDDARGIERVTRWFRKRRPQ